MTVPPPTPSSHIAGPTSFVYGAPPLQPFGSTTVTNALSNSATTPQSLYGPYVPVSNVQVQPSSAQMAFGTSPLGPPPNMVASIGAHNAFSVASMCVQPSTISSNLIPHQNSMVTAYASPLPQQMQSPHIGGSGMKRKLPFH